jgi:hypothetical protein
MPNSESDAAGIGVNSLMAAGEPPVWRIGAGDAEVDPISSSLRAGKLVRRPMAGEMSMHAWCGEELRDLINDI